MSAQSSKTYTGSFGPQVFMIEVPEQWEINNVANVGTVFIALTPADNKDDAFSENINLVTQDLTGKNVDLQYYIEYSEAQIEKYITDVEALQGKYIEIAGLPSYELEYFGRQGGMMLKFKQHFWIVNEIAYILTTTIEKDKLNIYEPTMSTIMNTFRFK